jgi:hypothetical protein
MMKKSDLRKSELFFIFLGLFLMSVSIVSLYNEFSLLVFYRGFSELTTDSVVEVDPFQANYSSVIVDEPAPSINASSASAPSTNASATNASAINAPSTSASPTSSNSSLPVSVAPTASTSQKHEDSAPLQALKDRQVVFLLFPSAHAFLTTTRKNFKGYPLKLKFEVEPKGTDCKLEVTHEESVVLSKSLKGSPSGFYEVSLLIKKPGLYHWQVSTEHRSSELREFVIRAQ